jgi:hypothetical protein
MANRLTYLEIPAADALRSARFYEAVLGWKIEHRPDGDPRFEDEAAHLIGRWVTGRESTREAGLLPYLYVDGVLDAVTRVGAAGGEVAEEARREGDVWVARIRDPAGNLVGIWEFAGRSEPDGSA